MARSDITRRQVLLGGAAAGFAAGAAADPAPDAELICVAPDRWSFQTAKTRKSFVPFGSNLVLTSKDDLDIFGPRYTHDRYDRILDACEGAGINVLKVFLPIHVVLPDPQQPGEANVTASYLDNLDDFLALCTRHRIRALVTLAEWGGHSLKWWNDGGQYFGRRPWRIDAGIDSLDVLARFWTVLGRRLRGDPAVFAYSLMVEWSMPNGNLTPPWAPPPDQAGLVPGEIALWYWRTWLEAKYRSLDALNRAHATAYGAFSDIPPVNYAYDEKARRYAAGDHAVLDYQSFREWASLRYFRPQIAAIRAADPTHMVTVSNHERCWNLWEGAARHFLGYTPAEEKPLVDFVTHHDNRSEAELSKDRTMDDIVRELEVMGRFAHAGRPTPVIVEEFTYASPDAARNAAGQAALVRGTVGHLSGWMTWYLQYPTGANAADAAYPSAWFDADFRPTPWGETARALRAELQRADLRRKPPARTVALDRSVELAPKTTGTLLREMRRPAAEGPTDYTVRHEPDLDVRLRGDRLQGTGDTERRLRCRPVISGNLRPYDHSLPVRGSDASWARELDDERALGFDLLWLSHIGPALRDQGTEDRLGAILDLCAERGMKAILDVGSTPNWYGTLDLATERQLAADNVREIARRAGKHPAFHGWYIPHEIYVAWDRMGAYVADLYPAVADTCRSAAPGKPVTLSPFFILDREQVFGAFRWASPEEYGAYWAKLLRRSGIDIVMLQDSGEHFSYVTNAQRRPFFAAMREACASAGACLWGNVETAEFECPSIEEYVRRYGRVHHSTVPNPPWRAVPISRLENKLRLAAEYCERIVTWGYYQFGRPSLGPKAAAWYGEYRRYVEGVRALRHSRCGDRCGCAC